MATPPPTNDTVEIDAPQRFSGASASASGSSTAIVPTTASATTPAPSQPRAAAAGVKRFVRQQVPDEVLNDAALNESIKALPTNYNFEIHKTVWRLKQAGSRAPALQLPEGLLMYACVLADIMERHAGVDHCIIMGDVTYGACCIDDLSAQAMGADFLVHYGHSCLVPLDVTCLPCLYVFVDIAMDVEHMVGSVRLTFPHNTHLVLAGTIQFSSGVQAVREALAPDYPSLAIPKCRPLSPGEVLGCTAPVLTTHADAIVFVADGRFHLEAIMIANPTVPAYRYDPYSRLLTREYYDQEGMRAARRKAVESARGAQHWGVVLGTLGRQGNPTLAATLTKHLEAAGKRVTLFLVSELSPQRLQLVEGVEAWAQVACPRLSIDWGEAFTQPTLTPYETLVTLGVVPPWWEQAPTHVARTVTAGAVQGSVSAQGGEDAAGSCGAAEGVQGAGAGVESDQLGAGWGTCGASSTDKGVCARDDAGAGGAGSRWPEGLTPYPMDYYAKEGGVWNSSYHKNQAAAGGVARVAAR